MKLENIQAKGKRLCLSVGSTGRWDLQAEGSFLINGGLCAMEIAGQHTVSSSESWDVEETRKGRKHDSVGTAEYISVTFRNEASLRIIWEGGVYVEGLTAFFNMRVENIGTNDAYLNYLAPIYVRGEKSGSLIVESPAGGSWKALHNGMWMGERKDVVYTPDDRGMQDDYHVSALCNTAGGGCIVAGMGERANTVIQIGWARRINRFEMAVKGLMMVNRHKKPFRLKAGQSFAMNRVVLESGRNVFDCLESYGDYLAAYTGTVLKHKPHTGIFCAYGPVRQEPSDWMKYFLTDRRISELMDITDKYLAPYGFDYIKTQFGGVSSGPGTDIVYKRDWSASLITPEAGSPKELADIIEEQGFTPDTHDLKAHMPAGVSAVAKNVRRRGYKHALVCRPFLNVESGGAYLDEYAAAIFKMCVEKWGYDYLMLDFISTDFENDIDDTITLAQGITNRFKAIRDAVGDNIFIEACMCMFGPVIGIADGFRPAGDWRGGLEPELSKEVSCSYYLHGKIFQMDLEVFDPDVTPLRWWFGVENAKRQLFQSLDRVRSWVSFSALSGFSYLTGGVIDGVTPERWHIFTRAMPVYGRSARPLNLFEGEPSLLKLDVADNGRAYTVSGIFNWDTAATQACNINFEALGLMRDAPYLLYDFWGQRYLGTFINEYHTNLPPGSCLILFIHCDEGEPVYLGNDRHVTGAFGNPEFTVDPDVGEITGVSEGPAGTKINQYIYMPTGRGPSDVQGCECEIVQPGILRVSVNLDTGKTKWSVKLSGEHVSI